MCNIYANSRCKCRYKCNFITYPILSRSLLLWFRSFNDKPWTYLIHVNLAVAFIMTRLTSNSCFLNRIPAISVLRLYDETIGRWVSAVSGFVFPNVNDGKYNFPKSICDLQHVRNGFVSSYNRSKFCSSFIIRCQRPLEHISYEAQRVGLCEQMSVHGIYTVLNLNCYHWDLDKIIW